MAGALVGGAFLSAFLQVAFDRLASRDFRDFFKGRKDIDGSLKKLKMLLRSAYVVLVDAEDNQYTNPDVKEWLDDLQDAVYDADDLLDEIALRCKLQAESQTGTSEVRNFITAFVDSFDKEIPFKLEKILADLDSIIDQMGILSLKKDIVGVKLSSPPSQTKTSCPATCDVIGRDMDKEEIFKLWQSDVASEICVVPIVGMGGIGKTTLAQFVFNDEKVKKSFDLKAWVCVSENFDNLEILKAISEGINGTASNFQYLQSLEMEIQKTLKGKKFFLVLDDVWNENYDVWDNFIKVFKCEAQEVKIIVTTRSEKVARVVTVSTHYFLNELSNEDCMKIFVHSAFGNRNLHEFPQLLEIGKEIVEKCRGLPLAAKTLGGSLRSNFNQNDWIKIWKSHIWDLPDAKTNIFPALRLSYHYIPSHLKRCFTYSSIFPKGYEFEKEELILLWMAEGLLQQPKEARRIELEEIGEEYFNDLVSRSFFQQSSKSKSCFLMHDLINDLAKSICGKFCFRLDESNESNEITKETRHLSYYKADIYSVKEFEIPLEAMEAKGLRTLLVKSHSPAWMFKDKNIVKMDLNLLQNFKFLRVLSLYGIGINKLPITIDNLVHLRYLNSCYTGIKDLPDSLCNLYNLQTLILSSDITKLPTNMSKLINLRHLDNSGAWMKEMPPQMGKMKNLRKLSVFGVGIHDDGSSIKELGELQHLSGKLSLLNLENVQCINKENTEVILKNKQDLSELELKWKHRHGAEDSEKERILLEQLCPCTNLNSLTITNYEGTSFPKWLGDSSFSKMVSIELSDCDNCFSLPPLGQLPDLKSLRIEYFGKILSVGLEFYGNTINPFRALEYLSFKNMPEWQEWVLLKGEVFTCLRELYIEDCPKLIGGLPVQLPSLTKLDICECKQLVASLPNSPALHQLLLSYTGKIEGGVYSILPFPPFASLSRLEICECPDLVSFPSGGLSAPNLSEIVISMCENLKSLPEGMHTLLPSLVRLDLGWCTELESFPEGGLPSSLESLAICRCEKLISRRMALGLQGLHSLKSFTISNYHNELESFPEEALLPPNLTDFTIGYLPNLKSLNASNLLLLFFERTLWKRERGGPSQDCPHLQNIHKLIEL
ncbi:putative disease resistance protein At3g14460 [Quercus suber]|uniref:putative disease resistance protein At3g14460 n=1 Tax=Quercus suber TaxID=58331 RepID=UPI0032DFA9C7